MEPQNITQGRGRTPTRCHQIQAEKDAIGEATNYRRLITLEVQKWVKHIEDEIKLGYSCTTNAKIEEEDNYRKSDLGSSRTHDNKYFKLVEFYLQINLFVAKALVAKEEVGAKTFEVGCWWRLWCFHSSTFGY